MNVSVVICAAGKGTRAGFNKLLAPYQGIPVVERTICAFLREDVSQILLAHSAEDQAAFEAFAQNYPVELVEGGETRTQPVRRALQRATGDAVLIHDGARPFVSQAVIDACIESVRAYGSGVAAIPATDTICIADETGAIASTPTRAYCYMVQTPQGFETNALLAAYKRAVTDGNAYTDDASVYAAYCGAPKLCAGDRANKKLTFADDFYPTATRVGFGVDTHAFATPERNRKQTDEHIFLCGVRVPSHSRLVAHSDGDVAVHAVMDALLSAAGKRDIGHYFPDTDERYKGANSMQLLGEVLRLLQADGLRPDSLSVAIQAEAPRLANYISQMQQTLAEALSLPVDRVGVTAGTNEKLGYVGEGKGITAYAYALCRTLVND